MQLFQVLYLFTGLFNTCSVINIYIQSTCMPYFYIVRQSGNENGRINISVYAGSNYFLDPVDGTILWSG